MANGCDDTIDGAPADSRQVLEGIAADLGLVHN
jgi:hypothetical protein